MNQKIAEVDKKIEAKAKQADRTDSPTMQKPFDKLDTAKKFEQLGLLAFSDNEDDELSLETITSHKSKVSNKSQGSQKSTTKPKVKQPNNVMPRTATKKVKESEKTPFHQDAFEAAGGIETPEVMGSDVGGWIIQGGRQSICNQLTSPKGIANLMRLNNPTPPQTDSNSGSAGSNSNRFAALQEEEEEDSDATTDIVPIDGIAEASQEGAVLIQADSNEVPDNIQVQVAKPEVEGGIVPQENDLQPDGVVSSKEADFPKAESE